MAVLVQFDRRGQWGETLVCDSRIRECLRPHGIAHGCRPPVKGEPAPPAGEREMVRHDRDRATLFYFRLRAGWLGLLCDAGEWVAIPAQQRHWLVDGTTASGQPAPLPAWDDFIERLLALTGDEPAS